MLRRNAEKSSSYGCVSVNVTCTLMDQWDFIIILTVNMHGLFVAGFLVGSCSLQGTICLVRKVQCVYIDIDILKKDNSLHSSIFLHSSALTSFTPAIYIRIWMTDKTSYCSAFQSLEWIYKCLRFKCRCGPTDVLSSVCVWRCLLGPFGKTERVFRELWQTAIKKWVQSLEKDQKHRHKHLITWFKQPSVYPLRMLLPKKAMNSNFYQLWNKLRPKSGVGREAGSEEEVWEE